MIGFSGRLFFLMLCLVGATDDEAPENGRMMRAERIEARGEVNRHLGAAIDMAGELQLLREDVDCVWGDWVDWSVCQYTCGGGEAIRTRKVKVMAHGDGAACSGGTKETRECIKNDCPIDCMWGNWSAYSSCSVTCGTGSKSRRRGFRQVAEFGGVPCAGNTTQSIECNLGDCPLDCQYADWDQWGGCSKSCGSGLRHRFRSVAVQPVGDGKSCAQIGSNMEETACGQNHCPVDCVLEDWEPWECCGVTCGVGSTKRTRSVKVAGSYGGLACESLTQNKSGDSGPCPVDCKLSAWSDWGVCDRSCKTESEPGTRKRFRSVLEAGNELGEPCPLQKEAHLQSGSCLLEMCPVDCALSDWTSWSECSVSCGAGISERNREVEVAAAYGGRDCQALGNLTYEKKYCSMEVCPVDCEWNDWQEWRACSTSCGPGTGVRMRVVKTPMLHGGKDCEGGQMESRDCNLKFCPIHCAWADWSDWAACTTSCNNGTSTRERRVTLEADYGGSPCTGEAKISRGCFQKPCPVHCQWTDWTQWTDCTSSCGTGLQTRGRSVAVQPEHEGLVCEGFASDSRSCGDLPPCPVDCEWDEWSDWAVCSKTCGTGVSKRSRERKKYEKDGGHVCFGTEDDQQVCTMSPCPVDCTMGDWSQWTTCSVTCGEGSQLRLRGIRTGPANGGQECSPIVNETKSCEGPVCPVDCQWSFWEPWSICSHTCNGGTNSRKRKEKVSAAHGGRACAGSANEDGLCNVEGCPVDCKWVPWSEWTGCSSSCGGGIRSQSRVVAVAPQWGGLECETENDLGGPANEKTESCNEQPCPVDCQWSSWSKYTLCSKTCDTGTMSRNRKKNLETFGGRPCTGDAEESNFCNTQGCPRDCTWADWTEWTRCSKNCGGGEIKRFRDVAVPRKNGGEACSGPSEEQAECNTEECPVHCEWDAWSDWTACPVTCNGAIRSHSRVKKQEAGNGGLPCVGNFSEKEFCNSNPCPVDCRFDTWEPWGECSRSCGIGQRFRTRVKSSELFGGHPCEEAMVESGECGSADAPGCPVVTTTQSTTTTLDRWGERGSGPFEPSSHGQQHEIPLPSDLLKNFSSVKDPRDLPTTTQSVQPTQPEAREEEEPGPNLTANVTKPADGLKGATVKPHNDLVEDLKNRSEKEENSSNSSMTPEMDGLKGATVKPHNDLVEDAKDQIVNDGKVEATPDADVSVESPQQAAEATVSMAAAESQQTAAEMVAAAQSEESLKSGSLSPGLGVLPLLLLSF